MALELLKSPLLADPVAVVLRGYQVMTPPPRLEVVPWAEENIYLSEKVSAEPGWFRVSRIPYAREPLNCWSDPLAREITLMWAAQCAKTTVGIDIPTAYFMKQDPSRIAVIMEDEDKQKYWSVQRFTPMVDNSPALAPLVSRKGGPDSQNTLEYKDIPGGYVAILNSGSEADLASRASRIVLKDEIDKWKMLKAGDPDRLADKRAQNSFNKKIGNISTPRDHNPEQKIYSRIVGKYEASDKRKFYMPCPFCGHLQYFRHEQIKFDREHNTGDAVTDAWYECESETCGIKKIHHIHKRTMLARGRWIAEKPFNGHAGFWLNALYSPWITFKEYAEEFLKAKRQKDTFKTFVNEWMAQPWNPDMEIDKEEAVSPYLTRREPYERVPLGAAYLTAVADVQGDRIEVEVKAWGPGRESWGMEHKVLIGEPLKLTQGSKNLPQVWQDLDAYLQKTWEHESGAILPISICFIDSGDGNATTIVYRFCKPRRYRNIFPCKGVGGVHELVNNGKIVGKERVRLFSVGTNECKNIIFSNLWQEAPTEQDQPFPSGYMHFNRKYNADYFKQLLTSERQVPATVNRKRMMVWDKVHPGARNEAVDLNVYSLAAYERLNGDPEMRVRELRKLWEQRQQEEAAGQSPDNERIQQAQKQPKPQPHKNNFVTGWRR